ncbi:MAG: DUF4160 domain-containing protein [Acidimicrobiia bacterium]|nr:DUF4160 domain-containing protein [Acidimicrobiia bacterium]
MLEYYLRAAAPVPGVLGGEELGIGRVAVLEDDVGVAVRVERGVEVDQVDAGVGQVAAQDVARVPTVLRAGPYRFFIWSNEPPEPAHVHVESSDGHAKFWLDPVSLADADGYNPR